jgi:hypothetical protein
MSRNRFRDRLRIVILIVLAAILLLLQAAPGGMAQEGPWTTVRKYCLLALLAITWGLLAFCVLSGAGVCVRLLGRLRGQPADEDIPEGTAFRPGEEV